MGMDRLIFFLVVALCTKLCRFVESAPKGALVTSLPGFNGSLPSKHYAGYVKLRNKDNNPPKNLYYYFVVSERNPTTDPVVLWLNGGPGCSSFDGFVYEHGPFIFEGAKQKGGLPTLHLNPYSWSKVSNIIYLDSPTGVGFSYSLNTSIYSTGDLQTAFDTYCFLFEWFKKFPEFLANKFYIAGESYAGIYIPTLASHIDKGLKNGAKPIINFKGYMIGNGVTDPVFDGNALVPFAHGHGLIPDQLFKQAEVGCNGSYYSSNATDCMSALTKIDMVLDDLNIYDILEPCYHSPPGENGNMSSKLPENFKQLGKSSSHRGISVRKRMFGRAWPYRTLMHNVGGYVPLWSQILVDSNLVPCTDDRIATAWLNDKEVRKAIHASPESGDWAICITNLMYARDTESMITYHRNLVARGYRVLIYSGDHDMCVPYTGSQAWTQSMGYKVVDEWRSWETNGQVAGFLQKYANDFTFLTIKGAGHTVPEYKPQESLYFYDRWLQDQTI